jgi:hypothetical protein
MEEKYFTVEQASRHLTCAQPLDPKLLQKLGKDCSMVCRIRNAGWVDVPVFGKRWNSERGYPFSIILEVFTTNPDTAPHVPKATTK